mgnify:CR=1 FL=1
MMATLPSLLETSSRTYVADTSTFGGLGTAGLITVIIVSILLIAAVAWLIHGTKRRD